MNFDEDSAGRILTVILVATAVVAALYLILGRDDVRSEDAEHAARRWAARLGMEITGVVCNRTRCTIAPATGEPFVVYCNVEGCSMSRAVHP